MRPAQARIASGASADAKPLLERAVQCLTNGLEGSHPLTVEVLAGAPLQRQPPTKTLSR